MKTEGSTEGLTLSVVPQLSVPVSALVRAAWLRFLVCWPCPWRPEENDTGVCHLHGAASPRAGRPPGADCTIRRCLFGEQGRVVKFAESLRKVFTMKKKDKSNRNKDFGRKGVDVWRDKLHQYQPTIIHINKASKRRCWSHEIIAACYKEVVIMIDINSGLLGMKNMTAEIDSMSWNKKSKKFSQK